MCIVRLLLEQRDYGLGIAKRLEDAGFSSVPGGTLYPALVRLETSGLIVGEREASRTGPPRKYFRLTEEGRRAAHAGAADWESFSAQMSRVMGAGSAAVRK
ncbi:PadR family transcriptional regulator [Aeromicrobium sp. 9AM]|uniref:PadR family transcriptional regulator n=1 Tax=Aeromicrobium sp. 9AM TaxID=2653126 RepID=UPI00352BC064